MASIPRKYSPRRYIESDTRSPKESINEPSLDVLSRYLANMPSSTSRKLDEKTTAMKKKAPYRYEANGASNDMDIANTEIILGSILYLPKYATNELKAALAIYLNLVITKTNHLNISLTLFIALLNRSLPTVKSSPLSTTISLPTITVSIGGVSKVRSFEMDSIDLSINNPGGSYIL